jgi:hypothetical protein
MLVEKTWNLLLEMCFDVGSICYTMGCDTKFNKRCRNKAISEFSYDAILTLKSLKLVVVLPKTFLQCWLSSCGNNILTQIQQILGWVV